MIFYDLVNSTTALNALSGEKGGPSFQDFIISSTNDNVKYIKNLHFAFISNSVSQKTALNAKITSSSEAC